MGSILELGNQPHQALTELSKIYGPIMSLKLGNTTAIVISSPQVAEEVLQKHDHIFSSRTIPDTVRALDHHMLSVAWMPPSAQWRTLRRVCATKVFSSLKLDTTRALRLRKVEELLDYVKENCKKGEPLDIGEAIFITVLNFISNSFFSMDLAHYTCDKSQEFKDIMSQPSQCAYLVILDYEGQHSVSASDLSNSKVDYQNTDKVFHKANPTPIQLPQYGHKASIDPCPGPAPGDVSLWSSLVKTSVQGLVTNSFCLGHSRPQSSLRFLIPLPRTSEDSPSNLLLERISYESEEAGRPNVVDFFPIFRLLDPHHARARMNGYFEKLTALFDALIEERLCIRGLENGSKACNDVLDFVLELMLEDNSQVSRPHVLHLFLDLFVAGIDTTSSTIEWTMTELMRNPEKLEKVKEELQQILTKGEQVEESHISKLPFLRAVVKETLRLHPPVPFLLPHKSDVDVELCGYMVPKSAQIMVNVWGMGRDSTIWENPNEFMPERFLDSEIDFKGKDFELIPFGSGRRICPGLPLAYRAVHILLASLLCAYDWKLVDGQKPEDMDMSEKFGLTLHKAQSLRVIPIQA
ncbi:hypothetical protein VNO77_07088 [Canavalia gladiata]|uniref:Uncharacterized protein n=1 Tax=Canavalia gladiata TaxID=3824 RepID=A0AAN9M8V3_CANGL